MVREIKGKDCENGIKLLKITTSSKQMRETYTVPTMDKFVKFWAGIWDNKSETFNKKWMEKIKESMEGKIRKVKLQINDWERPLRREKTGQHREQTVYQISGGKH